MNDEAHNWNEHHTIKELIITEIFKTGRGDPQYLVPDRIQLLKEVHPAFSRVQGPTFYLLYKRAAAEFQLQLDREAVS